MVSNSEYDRGYRAGRRSKIENSFQLGRQQGLSDAVYQVSSHLSMDPDKRICGWFKKLLRESDYNLTKKDE